MFFCGNNHSDLQKRKSTHGRNPKKSSLGPILSLIVFCVFICAAVGASEANPAPPNIVFIMIDALRQDSLSCYGYERKTSPNIDRLAEKSIFFEDAVSVAGNTSLAMAAVTTGKLAFFSADDYPSVATMYGMQRFYQTSAEKGFPQVRRNFFEIMNEHGYETGAFITNPYLKMEFQFHHGFDHFEEIFQSEEFHSYGLAEHVTDRTIQWLKEEKEKPFLAYLHYMDVHENYIPPDEYMDCFEYAKVQNKPLEQLVRVWRREEEVYSPEYRNIKEHMKGLYDCEILYCDHEIGRLLDFLEQQGRMEDTIIVVTSDHGDQFLEHEGTTHKGVLYDELLKIPLVMYIPGKNHQKIAALVRNCDIMPTIMDYCGITEIPSDLDTVSLLPLIDGRTDDLDLTVFSNYMSGITPFRKLPRRRMVRDKRYKLIYNMDEPAKSEMFDLQTDPAETQNIYQSADQVRERLMSEIERYVARFEEEVKQGPTHFGVKVSLNSDLGFEGVTALRDAKAFPLSNCLYVKSNGSDPGLLLPEFRTQPDCLYALRFEMESSIETFLQVFWQTHDVQQFTPDKSQIVSVNEGSNSFYLAIFDDYLNGRIRIDPAAAPGDFEIRCIEVVEIEQTKTEGQGQWQGPSPAPRKQPAQTQEMTDEDIDIDEETLEQLRALGYMN